jgi:hypothetical protein
MESEGAYANPMLAMRCACSIVRHPFSKRPFDDRRRVYVAYMGLQFPSAEPIKIEARNNGGPIVSDWQITLTAQEESIINMLVDDFVLYSKLLIPEQDSR